MAPSPDPAVALLVFAALALLTAAVVWPGRGVVARLRRMAQLTERVRLEDGIKHLLTSEAAGRRSSVESLAGVLGVPRSRAVEILRQLERMDLARPLADDILLTEEGRAYALRIVRTHRIWERYLADSTGFAPEDWHSEAERFEHGLAPETVEQLAAGMGHPLYDPHGDPIPTADGILPPPRGVPLSALDAGASLRVVHIEDEPEEIFRSLRAAGIDVGLRVRLERVDASGFHLTVEGRHVAIDPLAARNLTVEAADDEATEEHFERLDALEPGDEGIVVRLGERVQGAQRRRLLDLGIVAGTAVRAEFRGISGDPMAYRIRGAVIALRRAQARDIFIRRLPREEAA
jgi:DtxR family Mn-dependent transcriptional regulator